MRGVSLSSDTNHRRREGREVDCRHGRRITPLPTSGAKARISDTDLSCVCAPDAVRRRQSIQPEQPRHGCQSGAPRAPQAEHESPDGGEGVAVNGAQIYSPACPASWAEDVEPRRAGKQRGPDCRRPEHVPAGGKSPIPAVDHGLRFGVCGPIGPELCSAGFDVGPTCPNAHVWNH
jgi:hypothetical protein